MKIDSVVSLNPTLLAQSNIATGAAAAPQALGKKHMDEKAIDATSKEFESMFLTEMLRPMFDTIDVDENFGGGKGEEVYKSFMVEEYGKNLSQNGGIGIAALVKEQLIAMQGTPALPASQPPVQKVAQDMHDIEATETPAAITGESDV